VDVGNSIRKAILDWDLDEFDSAMLHACNAVDGTAAKVYPTLGSKARFIRLLRDNYGILLPMGGVPINGTDTRFPVEVRRSKDEERWPDLAAVIYGVHRCHHGHGEELPAGFELRPEEATTQVTHGTVALPRSIIFGLLAVAVANRSNATQRVPDSFYFTFRGLKVHVNKLWGMEAGMKSFFALLGLPQITMDFSDWRPGDEQPASKQ
jgi:hypothetical protein